MTDILKELSKPLDVNDIELRVGNVSDGKGFALLAYKTARTDVKRLNDVLGLNWKSRHFYDDNKILCCEISVYNKEIGEWITREDVGTESQTEKEKGSYSDSFKRAGFKFGIGSELYKFPFIWVSWENCKNKKVIGFYPSKLEITEYEIQDEQLKKLTIKYDGKVIFSLTGKVSKPQSKPEPTNQELDQEVTKTIGTKCPKCGEQATKGALENWNMCLACKNDRSK